MAKGQEGPSSLLVLLLPGLLLHSHFTITGRFSFCTYETGIVRLILLCSCEDRLRCGVSSPLHRDCTLLGSTVLVS